MSGGVPESAGVAEDGSVGRLTITAEVGRCSLETFLILLRIVLGPLRLQILPHSQLRAYADFSPI